MGGRAGGSGSGFGSGSRSESLKRNLSNLENYIRNNDYESAYVLDENGKLLFSNNHGGETSAEIELYENSIVTHNHPLQMDHTTGKRTVQNSFSENDVIAAAEGNLKEIRAVTKNYVFSLSRPKRGWGKNTIATYAKAAQKADAKLNSYLEKHNSDASLSRVLHVWDHTIMKEFSRMSGAKYTKKKVK